MQHSIQKMASTSVQHFLLNLQTHTDRQTQTESIAYFMSSAACVGDRKKTSSVNIIASRCMEWASDCVCVGLEQHCQLRPAPHIPGASMSVRRARRHQLLMKGNISRWTNAARLPGDSTPMIANWTDIGAALMPRLRDNSCCIRVVLSLARQTCMRSTSRRGMLNSPDPFLDTDHWLTWVGLSGSPPVGLRTYIRCPCKLKSKLK